MNQGLLYLGSRTLLNRTRRYLRRLRDPRYAVAIIAGLAYVSLFLIRQPSHGSVAGLPEWLPALGSLGLLLLLARWWLWGGDRLALAFTGAEVHFLFPAPIPRRTLLHWKLWRPQGAILLNAMIWVVVFGRGRGHWFDLISFWVIFSTIHLHRVGAALVRASLLEHGGSGLRRQWPALLLLLGVTAGLALGVSEAWPAFQAVNAGEPAGILRALADALSSAPARIVLAPLHLLLAPLRAPATSEWLRTIWPAAVLLALHYLWVMRSDAAFEEAALRASAERARSLRERPGGSPTARVYHGRPWFPLRPTGPSAAAIVWKNLVQVQRTLPVRAITVTFGVVLVVLFFAMTGPAGEFPTLLGAFGVGITVMLVLFGPGRIRNDLRGDLPHLALLRCYPVEPWALVGAEVAGAALVLTAVELLAFALSLAAFTAGGPGFLDASGAILMLGGALVILLVFNTFAILIQNAGALLFPAWIRVGPYRQAGIEALGQHLLTMTATILLVAVCLIPPVTAGVAGWALLIGRSPGAAWGLGVGLAVLAAAAEFFLLLGWLGAVFLRADPSDMAAPEAVG